MSVKSIKNIMKGIGQKTHFVKYKSMDHVGTANKIADKIIGENSIPRKTLSFLNEKTFRDLTEAELASTSNFSEAIYGRKMKLGAEVAVASGITIYGGAVGLGREGNMLGVEEIEAGVGYDLTYQGANPTLQRDLEEQRKNQEHLQDTIREYSDRFGTSGAEMVFALHELRNR